MQTKGLFIVFEGIDGSGTSTHVHRLEEKIEELNKYQDILRTHEPWRSAEIKRKLVEDKDAYSNSKQIAELFVGDRTEHTRMLIRPNVEAGVTVLNARYKMSTCAYQWTQGMQLPELLKMHDNRGLLTPDLTFFIDVPFDVARKRVEARGKKELFEHDPNFVRRLISSYNSLNFMSDVDERIFGKVVGINGNRRIKAVADDIYQEFLKVYEKK